jgi:hypothetical protein
LIFGLKKNRHLEYHFTFFGGDGDDGQGGGEAGSYTDPTTGETHSWDSYGNTTTTHADGSQTSYNSDGTSTHTANDGVKTTYDSDGNWTSTDNDGNTSSYDASTGEYNADTVSQSFSILAEFNALTSTLKTFFTKDTFNNALNGTNQYTEKQIGENTFFAGTDNFGNAYSGVYSNTGWSLNEENTTSFGGTLSGVETTIVGGYTVTHIEDGLLDETYVTNFKHNFTHEVGIMGTLGYELNGVTGLEYGSYLGSSLAVASTMLSPMFGPIGLITNTAMTFDAMSEIGAYSQSVADYSRNDSFDFGDSDRNNIRKIDINSFEEYEEHISNPLNFDDDLDLDVWDFQAGGVVYNYLVMKLCI